MTDHDLFLDGRRIHYREWGDPAAPPVILLHGATSWLGTWDVIAETLAGEFHLFAPDLRGHGESDPTPTYSLSAMADDVIALANTLDIPRFRLVTHSLGSGIGWIVAANHPEMVERYVLADFAPDTPSTRAGSRIIVMLHNNAAEVIDTPEHAVAASRAPDEITRRGVYERIKQREDGRWVWKHDAAGLVKMFEGAFGSYTEEEKWADLARITVPTLLVRGGNSTTMRQETAERMQATIPNSRLAVIDDTGHMVPFEKPDAFLDVVRPFLDRPYTH